jgi:ATP-dependent Lon protease
LLRDIVLFPHMIVPLFVGREKTKRALDCAMAADKRRFVAVTQRQAGDDDTQEDLYDVGVIASVIDLMPLADGTIRTVARGLKRVTLTRFAESRGDATQGRTLARTVLERFQAYLDVSFASPLTTAWRTSANLACWPTRSRP